MLFHLDFSVEYSAQMTQNDLFTIWAEEANVALGAKQSGVVVDLWKAVGERRVIVIVKVESMGQHVHVKVTALRTYEGFAEDVKSRLA